MNIKPKQIIKAAEKHAPTILVTIGCITEVLAVVTGAEAGKKASDILAEERKKRYEEDIEDADKELGLIEPDDIPISFADKVKLTWMCWVPPIMVSAAGITAIILAHRSHLDRHFAMVAAYEGLRTTYSEYRHQVVERIGDKKEAEIRGEVAQKMVDRQPPTDKEVLMVTDGEVLCLDSTSGRYFKCSIEKIRRIENELNKRLMTEMWIPLNDLYYELGLQSTTTGRELGWNINRDGFIHFDYDSALDPNNNPCLVLGLLVEPREDYSEAH